MEPGTVMAVLAPVLGTVVAAATGRLWSRLRRRPPADVQALPPGSRMVVIEIGGQEPPSQRAADDER
jgi:hypothetical protein